MQRLSVEQVAILTILNDFDKEILYSQGDNGNIYEVTNMERIDEIIVNNAWDKKEVYNIIEELRYWGYITEKSSLTVAGRQYLRTGPNEEEVQSVGNNIVKNYNITLFEKLAEINGIKADLSAGITLVNDLKNIFVGLHK